MHESRDIRLVGKRLTNLVSTTSSARQTAMRYGLLQRISVDDFDNDEGEEDEEDDTFLNSKSLNLSVRSRKIYSPRNINTNCVGARNDQACMFRPHPPPPPYPFFLP